MRRAGYGLLVVMCFAIPWEYSLDLGEPWGNPARLLGLLLLLMTPLVVMAERRMRSWAPMQWAVLAFFLWFCATALWSIDEATTVSKLRGYFQEMMLVWLLWEYVTQAAQLRQILRAWVLGCWVLTALNVVNFLTTDRFAEAQSRFVATGQDANDVARFLDLGIPLAALLVGSEQAKLWRLAAVGYLFYGLLGVLLTASRGGFLAAVVALAGSGLLLLFERRRGLLAILVAMPPTMGLLWAVVPGASFDRLLTIGEQLRNADFNQRANIWIAGWHALVERPIAGWGAGTFVQAAGTDPIDTAHNTLLSITVHGGVVALFFATVVVAVAVWQLAKMPKEMRLALGTALGVWLMALLVSTVEESRTTWLLLGVIAVAGRLSTEAPEDLAAVFGAESESREMVAAQ